jgi:hypothetical protein
MGVSGFIEVFALALWSYELVSNMSFGRHLEKASTRQTKILPIEISARTKVADVLDRYPQTLEVFIEHGFSPLRNPVLRKTMARAVTIEQACRHERTSLDALLIDLRRVAG